MKISQDLKSSLDRTFPIKSETFNKPSEIEIKVQAYVEKMVINGCYWLEKATSLATPLNNFYRAAWLPYYILKSPLAYRMKISTSSVEKNIEVLSNVTAENVRYSVMPSSVRRTVPWMSLSLETASSISTWIGNAALLSPLVYAPAMKTFRCIWKGNGANTMDIHQIQLDIGECLDQNSKIYQGPEAVVGLVTSLALGILVKNTVSFALWMILKDKDLTYRYTALDKIYSDVAMNLKNCWDLALKENDEKEMARLKTIATKIFNGIGLIGRALQFHAWLTAEQVNDLKEKLTWSVRYILLDTGKIKPQNNGESNQFAIDLLKTTLT